MPFGVDYIREFVPGRDLLFFETTNFTLSYLTITAYKDDNTQLTYDRLNAVALWGITVSDFDTNDVIFV